jgi:regulator of protease activity HflC (stomatin/prohibitin superfamily)
MADSKPPLSDVIDACLAAVDAAIDEERAQIARAQRAIDQRKEAKRAAAALRRSDVKKD